MKIGFLGLNHSINYGNKESKAISFCVSASADGWRATTTVGGGSGSITNPGIFKTLKLSNNSFSLKLDNVITAYSANVPIDITNVTSISFNWSQRVDTTNSIDGGASCSKSVIATLNT